jgi:phosphoglycolate phosphatase
MKTIIWDYNGTILNDVGISVKIENEMLERRGLKHDYSLEDYKSLFDTPMEDYYRKIGYTFENETFHDVGVEFYSLYEKYFDECSLNDGVLNKLLETNERGYINIVLSSCEDTKLHAQCKQLNIDQYFMDIMGVDNLVSGSKVENGRQWMIDHDTKADECVFIGDTNADYNTAIALGIKNIYLVSTGHQSYERLIKLHDHVVHTVKEIKL